MQRRAEGHRVGQPIDLRRVIVVRKATVLDVHRSRRDARIDRVLASGGALAERLRAADAHHQRSVADVFATLAALELEVRVVTSLRRSQVGGADLIITVGGDGTFLRASHCVEANSDGDGTPMLGVNSSPETSVGFFCAATASTLEATLRELRSGAWTTAPLYRMRVSINGKRLPDAALNDALVAHRVPAETTRYTLQIGGVSQRQKSSGVWIATAAGSTGAIRSAGGRICALDDRHIQFRVRELFPLSVGDEVPLLGGFADDGLEIESHTAAGVLYLDGAHRQVPFGMGDRLAFATDPRPLPWVPARDAAERRDELRRRSERVLTAAGLRLDRG